VTVFEVLEELVSVGRCTLGFHEWGTWLPPNDEWKGRRFCARCPKTQFVEGPKVRVCCCGSMNPGSHVLRCEKCSKQFCWGILYFVTCPHCGYCAEEDDNDVD